RLLTFSCYHRYQLLVENWRCALLGEAIARAVDNHGFILSAFVFMPEHVHLLVTPWEEDARVSRLLFAIKRPFSCRVAHVLQQSGQAGRAEVQRLTVVERPGKTVFRFWQEGPGHDRNLRNPVAVANAITYIHNNPGSRG